MKLFSAPPRFATTIVVCFLISASATAAFAGGPVINVSVSPNVVTTQGEDAFITLSASTPPSRDLLINFGVFGTAILGQDYVLIDQNRMPAIIRGLAQVRFPAGQSSVDVILHTMEGDDGFRGGTTTFFIQRGTRYRVGHRDQVKVVIERVP